ncbi:GOLPH3/VPS74 family protein [Streptomyces acidicola]|uniref:GPP34 family phosphoprotein n=1 Tax=Streptomyces acidicola TaxID=2596892 RepID=A0A5N8WYT7_9ACTN|nr:GPP34 family phosphoprotein [Streptomyces acidicola]MPY52242.1 GPP34 family phosphoprotein [Streptomyces acidicola]
MTWTLPQRMYLLSCDVKDGEARTGPGRFRGHLMRAAALTELSFLALVRDERGKAVPAAAEGVDDRFLASVLDDVSSGKPRRWSSLIQHGTHVAEAAVRAQLAESGAVIVVGSPGLITGGDVVVNDVEQVLGLRERARNAVLLDQDPTVIPTEDLAMALLAAEGEVDSVFTLSERWGHRRRLKTLTKHLEASAPPLLTAFRTANATARSYNGGWA